jgi:hypothetical protein
LPVMLITTCLFMLHLSFTMSLHIVVVCVVFMAISLQFGKGLLVLICCELWSTSRPILLVLFLYTLRCYWWFSLGDHHCWCEFCVVLLSVMLHCRSVVGFWFCDHLCGFYTFYVDFMCFYKDLNFCVLFHVFISMFVCWFNLLFF